MLPVAAVGSLTEHQLLLFWVQLFVLVIVARGLGGLMRRVGQPAVIGELAAGLVVGPSLLGRLAPDLQAWLFPDDPVQTALLLAVSWIGVALLLVVTGFETDLQLLSSLGRSSLLVSTGSLVVPLLFGFALGFALPEIFLGDAEARIPFALFTAVALSISSLPVVAKILMDMNLMRRDIGQVTVAAGMANDLVGWILLGTLAGIVTGGGFALGGLVTTLVAIFAFLGLALTVGQRLVDAALRRARQNHGLVPAFTVVVLATLGAGAVTQAIGVEAVLGAFVAGIVLGRSRYMRREVTESLEVVVSAFFAPVFFATAGLSVDLGLLFDPTTALWALAVVAVAALAKFIGSFAGARLSAMSSMEGLAVSIGLNARGALEIVVATIGLGLGVLNERSYTVVVVMAMATSMMAPPLLRRVLLRLKASPSEAERLEREAVLSTSVIAGTKRALLPTRGGTNSLLAARLLDLATQPDTAVTVYTVHAAGDEEAKEKGEIAAREVGRWLEGRSTERLDRADDDASQAICAEASLGYGLVAVGMSEGFRGGYALSPALRSMLSHCPVPMLLVKHGVDLDPQALDLRFARVLVPAVGTKAGQAAEEVAYTLAARIDAPVDVVHVVNRLDKAAQPDSPGLLLGGSRVVGGLLEQSRSLAEKYGREANMRVRSGSLVGPELALAADESEADLIVLSAQVRSYGGEPFLGHGVEWLLEHARQTVAVVVLPAERADAGD